MAKRLQLTDDVIAAIKAQAGDIDTSKIVAYRAAAASTRPISQRHSPYNGARMEVSVLHAAAEYLQKETVPLLQMHENFDLPTGKVFSAEVVEADAGHHELMTNFYLEADDPLVSKIDLGIIDEVSVGMLTKSAFCSECGEDWMAKPMAFYWNECPECEKAPGEDGMHLRLVGLERWSELSLVGKGASSRAKILSAMSDRLGEEAYEQLTASAKRPEAAYLFCSSSKQEPGMDLEKLVNDMTEIKANHKVLESAKAAVDAELTAAQDKVVELEAKVAELEANSDEAKDTKITELEASVETEKEARGKVEAYLSEQYKVAVVAAGMELKEDATAEEMIASLEQAQVKLAAIPRGGVSDPADAVETGIQASYSAAFSTK